MRVASFNGATIVELDSNGDRISDFQIELAGGTSLGFNDFLGLEIDAGGRSKKIMAASSTTSSEQGQQLLCRAADADSDIGRSPATAC